MVDPFETAKSWHQAGRWDEAEAGYRAVLDKDPQNADALNMMGNVLADQERWGEAAECYRGALAVRPDKAAAQYNLGNALSAQGLLREAVEAYRQAVVLRPDYAKAYFNLGNVLFDLGEWDEATDAYRQALDADPEHPDADALFNLGRALHHQGKAVLAMPFYQRALQRRPKFPAAYHALGVALLETGKPKEALRWQQRAVEANPDEPATHFYLGRTLLSVLQFGEAEAAFRRTLELDPQSNDAYRALGQTLDAQGRQAELPALADAWLRARPDDPEALHYHTAWTKQAPPSRASDEFLRATFDGFADDFDQVLQILDYRAPQLLQSVLRQPCGNRGATLDILDAGCGTGLCGPLLRPWAARLVGVDLSSRMLDRARQRGMYDELIDGELTAYLQRSAGRFDVIVAADTLVYFGDLRSVLSAAAGALKAGGYLAFTLEHLPGAEPPAPFQLESHGRYSHSEDFVRQAVASQDLRLCSLERVVLRREGGQDVGGLLVLAARPG